MLFILAALVASLSLPIRGPQTGASRVAVLARRPPVNPWNPRHAIGWYLCGRHDGRLPTPLLIVGDGWIGDSSASNHLAWWRAHRDALASCADVRGAASMEGARDAWGAHDVLGIYCAAGRGQLTVDPNASRERDGVGDYTYFAYDRCTYMRSMQDSIQRDSCCCTASGSLSLIVGGVLDHDAATICSTRSACCASSRAAWSRTSGRAAAHAPRFSYLLVGRRWSGW